MKITKNILRRFSSGPTGEGRFSFGLTEGMITVIGGLILGYVRESLNKIDHRMEGMEKRLGTIEGELLYVKGRLDTLSPVIPAPKLLPPAPESQSLAHSNTPQSSVSNLHSTVSSVLNNFLAANTQFPDTPQDSEKKSN